MISFIKEHLIYSFHQVAELDDWIVIFVGLMMITLIILDDIIKALGQIQERTGLSENTEKAISIDDLGKKEGKEYISKIQGLAGRPDAVIKEHGYFIPVERKPLTNRVRDRYVAQLLVYMRLVEEFEGKKPPYGYLIVGKNARKVKIENSEQRQQWLSEKIEAMREHLKKPPRTEPVGEPHVKKCRRCKVKEHCSQRIDITA